MAIKFLSQLSWVLIITVGLNTTTFAEDTTQIEKEIVQTKERIELKKQQVDIKNQEAALDRELDPISSIGWDIGLAAEWYNDKYIADASIGADGIIRVTESYDVQPSFWLQFSWLADKHWLWKGSCESVCTGGFYSGVKVAGQNSTSLDALSLGVVLASFKMGFGDTSQGSNIKRVYLGFGPVFHKTRTFSHGINEGQALPAGLTEIKYNDSYERSWLLMIGLRI